MAEKFDSHREEGDYIVTNRGGYKRMIPIDNVRSIRREGGYSYIEMERAPEHRYDSHKDEGNFITVNKGGYKKKIAKLAVKSIRREGGYSWIEHD